jgi:hypothetical protein
MKRKRNFNVYRDGKVYVTRPMCATCIYRPASGDTGHAIIREAKADETAVVCHSTLDTKANAVCGGFYTKDPTTPLLVAKAMGLVEFAPAPKKVR